ncbi:hypothetical protein CAOG_03411 [Capsaspora owczarzaki ATCC 30864]|uniref:Uncharacterized protein n=1 Tax=Capsaspora owczarzaki (strain ATCC 30864) TaxID=595528 RepID=A0A0D2WN26_CAPO3|nr:hypothetical protein CAOG_03411 [Capsaspora owczarzaki ATCC 30864]KJE92435.1 hypothetical protein CAOG_003411 [Capsaspora owczarzaki ATCC 30864]|eukprot:XP_004364250.2 hypothetical protein CAOG_03411 [Capsaspora owczarzaki ATCC 30864]
MRHSKENSTMSSNRIDHSMHASNGGIISAAGLGSPGNEPDDATTAMLISTERGLRCPTQLCDDSHQASSSSSSSPRRSRVAASSKPRQQPTDADHPAETVSLFQTASSPRLPQDDPATTTTATATPGLNAPLGRTRLSAEPAASASASAQRHRQHRASLLATSVFEVEPDSSFVDAAPTASGYDASVRVRVSDDDSDDQLQHGRPSPAGLQVHHNRLQQRNGVNVELFPSTGITTTTTTTTTSHSNSATADDILQQASRSIHGLGHASPQFDASDLSSTLNVEPLLAFGRSLSAKVQQLVRAPVDIRDAREQLQAQLHPALPAVSEPSRQQQQQHQQQQIVAVSQDTSIALKDEAFQGAAGSPVVSFIMTEIARQRQINEAHGKLSKLNTFVSFASLMRQQQLEGIARRGAHQISQLQVNVREHAHTIDRMNDSIDHLEDEVEARRLESERLRVDLSLQRTMLDTSLQEYRTELEQHRAAMAQQQQTLNAMFMRRMNRDLLMDSGLTVVGFLAVNSFLVDFPLRLALVMVPREKMRVWLRQVVKLGLIAAITRTLKRFASGLGLHNNVGSVTMYAKWLLFSLYSQLRNQVAGTRNSTDVESGNAGSHPTLAILSRVLFSGSSSTQPRDSSVAAYLVAASHRV